MAEVQQKYAANETAQATAQPVNDTPHALLNALASFVAGMSEPALAAVTAQLTAAVVVEAAGAGPGAAAGVPPGKGKAGLPVMLGVILRTRPQVALQQRPQLLQPLLAQRQSKEAFKKLMEALPARHRTHLTAGKGWQGACARVAEGACSKLQRRAGGGWGGTRSSNQGASSSSKGGMGLLPLVGVTFTVAGIAVVAGLYRREVAGVVSAYAGQEAAEKVDVSVLAPLEAVVLQGRTAVEPYLQQYVQPVVDQVVTAAEPAVVAAWKAAEPVVEPLLAHVQQSISVLRQQVEEIVAQARSSGADIIADT
eukprot:gene9738-9896_t